MKHRIFFIIGMLMVFLLLCGCASGGGKAAGVVPATPVPAEFGERERPEEVTFFLTDIGVSTLPSQRCGMVLWTLDANRPVPVMRYISGDNGIISFNRVPFELIRLNVEGPGNFGVFEQQEFAAGSDILVNVDVEFGQGFDGGTYLKRGVIRVERPGEPILVTPVAGLAGCRT